ncbi:GNAT family N-acetyltransferase [Oceanobacillus neutriphilus]|uniref:Zwittermicin A resistance protein ZmaR n=1 Tax=Oceanobacillus neutriphilus TaxID=531815 RepID=A0ABQ2NXT7_9BACI|nr:GNAT family N-acetyltransferase [Oceanobacillus neutriphilus]GGP13266.1 zwittermicin A resistance protein ZmaR [Oceanobacillus neutriphilus]
MIYKANTEVKKKLVPMFENMDSTIILSYMQGYMGDAWVDNLDNPTVAQITVGIFVFYAGDSTANEAVELLYNLPEFALVIAESDEWKSRIETVHRGKNEKFPRYRFEKNPEHLSKTHLLNLMSSLPEGYEIKKVDSNIATAPSFQKLSEDFISQFKSIDDFIRRGTGHAIIHNRKVVAAATSFSVYDDGIEIEIATHPGYRRKGLATAAASSLILDCLDNGRYPSWDGANIESAELAKKLGYVFKETYDTYFINQNK